MTEMTFQVVKQEHYGRIKEDALHFMIKAFKMRGKLIFSVNSRRLRIIMMKIVWLKTSLLVIRRNMFTWIKVK